MKPSAIKKAVDTAGGQSALAAHLELPAAQVWQWVNQRRPVPSKYCPDIEAFTGVSRYDLRPDDGKRLWPELAAPSQKAAA